MRAAAAPYSRHPRLIYLCLVTATAGSSIAARGALAAAVATAHVSTAILEPTADARVAAANGATLATSAAVRAATGGTSRVADTTGLNNDFVATDLQRAGSSGGVERGRRRKVGVRAVLRAINIKVDKLAKLGQSSLERGLVDRLRHTLHESTDTSRVGAGMAGLEAGRLGATRTLGVVLVGIDGLPAFGRLSITLLRLGRDGGLLPGGSGSSSRSSGVGRGGCSSSRRSSGLG